MRVRPKRGALTHPVRRPYFRDGKIFCINLPKWCIYNKEWNVTMQGGVIMNYKVIVRDPKEGTEHYIENLTKQEAVMKASEEAADKAKQIYISWAKSDGTSGYLNRNGDMDCPGQTW